MCDELAAHAGRYDGFVAGSSFADYVASMRQPRTWGDHVTLQAAADAYGVRVAVLTSYATNAYLEVSPAVLRSQRTLWLTLHAELHYDSLYVKGDVPLVGAARAAQLDSLAMAEAR